jgi:hypothetical protein
MGTQVRPTVHDHRQQRRPPPNPAVGAVRLKVVPALYGRGYSIHHSANSRQRPSRASLITQTLP